MPDPDSDARGVAGRCGADGCCGSCCAGAGVEAPAPDMGVVAVAGLCGCGGMFCAGCCAGPVWIVRFVAVCCAGPVWVERFAAVCCVGPVWVERLAAGCCSGGNSKFSGSFFFLTQPAQFHQTEFDRQPLVCGQPQIVVELRKKRYRRKQEVVVAPGGLLFVSFGQ